MKRSRNLFDNAFSIPSLLSAFQTASKNKRKRSDYWNFYLNLASEINSLHRELSDGAYRPRPYRSFDVYEPKKRTIKAPAFRDLVVQFAIYKSVYDVFNRSFIDQVFSCRKGKGIHHARDYAIDAIKRSRKNSYIVKFDVHKFFYSIDHSIMKKLLRKKIADQRMLEVMDMFVPDDEERGIPIGNLLSQLYSIIYMSELDHYIKRNLKVKKYCRYVDDFVCFDVEKSDVKTIIDKVEEFLKNELNLTFSFVHIQKSHEPFNFVGFIIGRTRTKLRRMSRRRFRRAVRSCDVERARSYIGMAKGLHGRTEMIEYAESINPTLRILIDD